MAVKCWPDIRRKKTLLLKMLKVNYLNFQNRSVFTFLERILIIKPIDAKEIELSKRIIKSHIILGKTIF